LIAVSIWLNVTTASGLAVGIEAVDDLIADLDQALS